MAGNDLDGNTVFIHPLYKLAQRFARFASRDRHGLDVWLIFHGQRIPVTNVKMALHESLTGTGEPFLRLNDCPVFLSELRHETLRKLLFLSRGEADAYRPT